MSPKKSRLLAVLAALLPPALAVLGCGGFLLLVPIESARDVGALAALVPMTIIIAALIASVLLYLAAAGRKVPTALAVLVASGPLLIGAGLTLLAMYRAEMAIAYASPDQVTALASVALSEALIPRASGSLGAAALLSSVAIGLALAAIALSRAGEETRASARALVAALPVTVALAIGAAGEAIFSARAVRSLAAIGEALPEDRTGMALRYFRDVAVVQAVATWVWVPGLLLTGIAAIWVVTRARPTAGRVIGAVALVIVVGLVVGVQVLARPSAPANLSGSNPAALPPAETDLPQTIAADPPPVAPMVVLAMGHIEVEDRPVADLRTELEQLAARLQMIATRNPALPFRGELLISADRATSHGDVVRAVGDAQTAGFTSVYMVVSRSIAARAAMPVQPYAAPQPGTGSLEIRLQSDGIVVGGPGGFLAPGCAPNGNGSNASIPASGGAQDLDALWACLRRMREESQLGTAASVRANQDVPWGKVAPVVAVVLTQLSVVSLASGPPQPLL